MLFCDPTLPEAGDDDLKGDDVPTWKSTYGVNEELGLDQDDASAPVEDRQAIEEPLEDELDLDAIDLDFGD